MASAVPSDPSSRQPAGFWQQTWMLFHKNFITKKRQDKKKLFGEIIVPIMYLGILCFLVTIINKREHFKEQTESFEEPQNVLSPQPDERQVWGHGRFNVKPLLDLAGFSILVAPNTTLSQNFTKSMQKMWEGVDGGIDVNITHYESEDMLLNAYKASGDVFPRSRLMGIVFSSFLNNEATWNPKNNFMYDILSIPRAIPSPTEKKTLLTTCRNLTSPIEGLESGATCPMNNYYFSSFLALQQLIEMTVLRQNLKAVGNPDAEVLLNVTMENVPKHDFTEGMNVALRIMIPLYSVIPMAQLINNLLVLIVNEKESRIKDGLRMVGVSDVAYWLSWIGVYGLLVTVFAVAFTIIMSTVGVLGNMDPIILFILFFLFGLSVVTFAFALTPFFHKPKTAGLAGTLILQFMSLLFLVQTFVEGADYALIPLKLISSLAFATALDQACLYEYSGGIQWRDLVPGNRGDGVLYSLLFLLFDTVFYVVLAHYLDHIIPNEFGVRRHPLFFLKSSYWNGSSKGEEFSDEAELVDNEINTSDGSIDPYHCEPVGSELKGKEAIKIKNIKKTYTSWDKKKTVEAVKGVSLNIYESQITAILGRNGAGKSTMFNILTGLVSPTSGSAVVFGLNTARPYDMNKLRKIVGVCLQYDLHFEALSVEEHLIFYGKLRGLNKEQLQKEVDTIIHDLKLNDRRHATAGKLSGGQKRKLSIGIALIGDPKVILLDEPTAGLDPVSRRHLWKLLQDKKDGKVILLTTHFMDEADILADRKAIVHDGILKCVGSSLFLKNRYGVGYYLTVEMNDRYLDTSASDNIIQKWIPKALASRKVVAHEIKYSLPNAESPKFASVFADFEKEVQKKETLNSFGVSMTTLEEVFLKISNDVDVTKEETKNENGASSESEQNLIQDTGTIRPTYWSEFLALFMLRFRKLFRSPQAIFFMLVMPIVFTAGGLALANVSTSSVSHLDITTAIYPRKDFHVAVTSDPETSLFSRFLNTQMKVDTTVYSGEFKDLLGINVGDGSAAAVSMERSKDGGFVVAMRVNGTYLHSPTIVLDLITKYVSKTLGGQNEFGSTLLRHKPFPEKKEFQIFSQASNYAPLILGPVFMFPCVGMIMEIVKDREIKARNHLRVNGVTFPVYFSSFFSIFGILTFLPIVAQIALIFAFQVEAYANIYAIVIIVGVILLFILPSLLFTAVFSYAFDKPDSAQSIFANVGSIGGMLMFFAILALDNFLGNVDPIVARILNGLFCSVQVFFVPYSLFYYLNKAYLYNFASQKFLDMDPQLSFSTYITPEIITILIVLLVQIPVFMFFLIVVDVMKGGGDPLHAIATLLNIRRAQPAVTHLERGDSEEEIKDEDVAKEKSKVLRHFTGAERNDNSVVAIKNLRKKYKYKKKIRQVLKGVYLMVEKGEVFGLLGHNGAGKTTTMKMITAEEFPDDGKVNICGHDITSNVSEAYQQLGFCPQHDALWENITLREHLALYLAVRGVPKSKHSDIIEHFLRGLKIKEHADKYSEKLSGGTKRKLSYAMSMVGSPKIVLMDEPSTGMDPQSKRFLWNTVLGTFKESRGAILTTHSMEEADVLCGRIGIMVKGAILCIGSPQHLKNKFGSGYTMEIKLKLDPQNELMPEDKDSLDTTVVLDAGGSHTEVHTSRVRLNSLRSATESVFIPAEFRFVADKFPDSKLVEVFGNRAVFSLPNDGVQSISNTFATLERLKSSHNVEEYSFSQTTLEQVFLTFAKENEENEEQ